MKRALSGITAGMKRVRSKAAALALFPAVALMSNPVFAALPTMPAPGTDMQGNAVASGDWLGSMGAWFKLGIGILGLVIAGIAFMKAAAGALQKWTAYTQGRAEIADLKEYFIMGAILMVFIIAMVTYAFSTTGQ